MRITGFGDYLIHFSPVGYERLWQCDSMKISYTGAEANVCAALALWGENVYFVTKVPENILAERGINFLKSQGINTDWISRGGERMGVYFLEKGASVRASKVIYDRKNSSFYNSDLSDYDFDMILDNTDVIYLSGITPSMSDNLLECCISLLKKAKQKNIKVFYDVNYRPAIASTEKSGAILKELSPYITCLISNEEHLKMLLGIENNENDERNVRLNELVKKVKSILPVSQIAVTVRRTISASDALIYGAFFDGNKLYLGNEFQIHVVDRVGSGDAFSAGLIYGYVNNFQPDKIINFALSSSAFKHTIESDINFSSVEEIISLCNGISGKDVSR